MKSALFVSLLICLCHGQYFVSLSGNDANAGSIDLPFATFNKARMMAQVNNVTTIYFRSGSYDYSRTQTTFGAVNYPYVFIFTLIG